MKLKHVRMIWSERWAQQNLFGTERDEIKVGVGRPFFFLRNFEFFHFLNLNPCLVARFRIYGVHHYSGDHVWISNRIFSWSVIGFSWVWYSFDQFLVEMLVLVVSYLLSQLFHAVVFQDTKIWTLTGDMSVGF